MTTHTDAESDDAAQDGERCDSFVEENARNRDRYEGGGRDDDARGACWHVQLALVEQQLVRGHPEEPARDDPAEIAPPRRARPACGGACEQDDRGCRQADERQPDYPEVGRGDPDGGKRARPQCDDA